LSPYCIAARFSEADAAAAAAQDPLVLFTEDGEELDGDQVACSRCGGMFAASDLLKV